MIGQYTAEEVCRQLSTITGIEPTDLLKNLEESCKNMKLVSPEVLELLGQLRAKGKKVLIATANMDTFNRWTVPALQLDSHYDGILNSFYIGALKEQGDKFFGKFLRQNGIHPYACLIIDDSEVCKAPLVEYGFDYRKIERGIGLVPELKKIVGLL